jgi:transposase
MWTRENRARYNRDHLRYPSDVTDAEWTLIAPLIPPARHGGRRREVDERNLVNGLMYVLSAGVQWRAIPKDLPPRSTIYRYFWPPRRLEWVEAYEPLPDGRARPIWDVSWFGRKGPFLRPGLTTPRRPRAAAVKDGRRPPRLRGAQRP